MTIALVAGQTASGLTTTSPFSVALPNNPTLGNFVLAGVRTGSSTTTAADGNGNTYSKTTKSPFVDVNSNREYIFYLANAPANASKTFTITTIGGSAEIWIAEFSGVLTASPFENDATANSGANSTNINTPSLTTTNDGDLLISCVAPGNNISTANSPWTGIGSVQNGNWTEYTVQAVRGAQATSFTQAVSANWAGIIAAFKAASDAKKLIVTRQSIIRAAYW